MSFFEFLSSAPWTAAAVFGGILLAAAGVAYGLATRGRGDRGFYLHAGEPVRWRGDDLPLVLYVSDRARELYGAEIEDVALEVSRVVGRAVFLELPPPPALSFDRPVFGCVTVRVDDSVHLGGLTDFRYARALESGFYPMESVSVTLSPSVPPKFRRAVVLHELAGHALGLAHDSLEDSFMYPIVDRRPRSVTATDAERLRRVYGGA